MNINTVNHNSNNNNNNKNHNNNQRLNNNERSGSEEKSASDLNNNPTNPINNSYFGKKKVVEIPVQHFKSPNESTSTSTTTTTNPKNTANTNIPTGVVGGGMSNLGPGGGGGGGGGLPIGGRLFRDSTSPFGTSPRSNHMINPNANLNREFPNLANMSAGFFDNSDFFDNFDLLDSPLNRRLANSRNLLNDPNKDARFPFSNRFPSDVNDFFRPTATNTQPIPTTNPIPTHFYQPPETLINNNNNNNSNNINNNNSPSSSFNAREPTLGGGQSSTRITPPKSHQQSPQPGAVADESTSRTANDTPKIYKTEAHIYPEQPAPKSTNINSSGGIPIKVEHVSSNNAPLPNRSDFKYSDTEPIYKTKIPVNIIDNNNNNNNINSGSQAKSAAHSRSSSPKMGNTMANQNNAANHNTNPNTTPSNNNNNNSHHHHHHNHNNKHHKHTNINENSDFTGQPNNRTSPGEDESMPSAKQQTAAAAAAAAAASAAKTVQQKCDEILDELKRYEKDVYEFGGKKGDKAYLKLEELLTRCLLKLDAIERGEDRKRLINFTHVLSDKLEEIASKNSASNVNDPNTTPANDTVDALNNPAPQTKRVKSPSTNSAADATNENQSNNSENDTATNNNNNNNNSSANPNSTNS